MTITKKINNKKTIIIIGYGFLAKSLIEYFNKSLNYNILCILKLKKIKKKKISNINFIDISKINKINYYKRIDVIINAIGNIDHNNFNSQTENQIFTEHFLLPKRILEKIKKSYETLFIQIGTIDELDQIKKNEFYKTPYALYKNYFSNYLLTLKYNKILNSKIVYVNSVFGKYQKKDRLIPLAINSLIKKKSFLPNNPHQKRNFISSEEFSNSINNIVNKHKKYKDKIIIKSKFDYKVGEIVSFILKNKNIKKYIASKMNNTKIDTVYVKENTKIETKLRKVIDFYANE